MPPSYKPLSASTEAAPTGVFAAPPNPSFMDFEQAEALRRAQELTNQMNELKAQQMQQQFTQQNELRNTLQSRFGPQPDGTVPEFNPNEALKLAQGLAIQNGDLDTALNIEKISTDQRGPRALTPAQRQLFETRTGPLPEDATLQDINALAAFDKAKAYGQQVSETADKRNDKLASLAPGGFEAVVDPTTGQGPTEIDSKKFTQTVVAHSRINSDLDMLEASLRAGGGNDPTDPEFARQKQIISDIAIALKEKNNFGAALTPNEQELNNAILPVILARNDVGVGGALTASGLGRDPFDAINTMRALFSTDFDQQSTIYKFRPRTDSGLPAAQSGQQIRIPRANSATGAAQERPGLTYQGIDPASGLPIYKKSK